MISLSERSTYKDGGSILYSDDRGNKYILDYSISSRNTSNYGKLFKYEKGKKNLAIGAFLLKNYRKPNKNIEQ